MNAAEALGSSKFVCNQPVVTPLGTGRVLAPFAVAAGDGTLIIQGVAVRLPVDATTQPALKKSNCLTPAATLSGLWVFAEDQLSVEAGVK